MKTLLANLALAIIAFSHVHAMPPALALTQKALQEFDPEIMPDHYEIAQADLNGDGIQDSLALANAKSGYCGSGGCTLFLLKGTNECFVLKSSVSVVNRPIYLRQSITNKHRDLLVTVRGGGARPGLAELRFGDAGYPPAPGEAAATLRADDAILFAETPVAFDRKLELLGITFHITSPNTVPGNTLCVTPAGLEIDNRPHTIACAGIVSSVETGDIDADGSPEIYIQTTDPAAPLIAYSANRRKSLSDIHLPELGSHAKGYRGGDEFAVLEGILGRRFPLYPDDPAATQPTGKMRQIQYKLVPGEAGWLLKPGKIAEF